MGRTKNTLTVAYIAKCTNCLKKHEPPLNEACLALVAAGGGQHVEGEDEQLVDGEEDTELLQQQVPPAGEIDLPLNPDNTQALVTDDPVAAQLANMAAALNSLAVMHNTTRTEMAQMRAELASIRAPPALASVMVPQAPPTSSAAGSHPHSSSAAAGFSQQPFIQCQRSGATLILVRKLNNWSQIYLQVFQVLTIYLLLLSGA
jgi:hypothetical protein